jgi:hypothetical protein
MLTMLPPTFGLKDSSNGGNLPFYAWYDRDHDFAAALAAQEVREARYMAALWWPVLILSAAALVGAHLHLGIMWEWAGASPILATLVAMAPASRRREAEFRGQSVECVVRRDQYATPLDTALDEAAYQLTRYKQFRGWRIEDIREGLVEAIPSAEAWARKNANLIRSAS